MSAMAHLNLDPKDAIEHATIICLPNATRLVWHNRLKADHSYSLSSLRMIRGSSFGA